MSNSQSRVNIQYQIHTNRNSEATHWLLNFTLSHYITDKGENRKMAREALLRSIKALNAFGVSDFPSRVCEEDCTQRWRVRDDETPLEQ